MAANSKAELYLLIVVICMLGAFQVALCLISELYLRMNNMPVIVYVVAIAKPYLYLSIANSMICIPGIAQ
eukprot:15239428-Alexandrium_andersonii.AAC.1